MCVFFIHSFSQSYVLLALWYLLIPHKWWWWLLNYLLTTESSSLQHTTWLFSCFPDLFLTIVKGLDMVWVWFPKIRVLSGRSLVWWCWEVIWPLRCGFWWKLGRGEETLSDGPTEERSLLIFVQGSTVYTENVHPSSPPTQIFTALRLLPYKVFSSLIQHCLPNGWYAVITLPVCKPLW